MSKPTPGNTSEQPDQVAVNDLALWSFLDQLKTQLRTIREDRKGLRFCLRLTCEYFQVNDGCFAVLAPDGSDAEVVSLIPRAGQWDLTLLAAFLRRENSVIPRTVIMAPVNRRGRLWAVLAVRSEGEFERHSARALLRVARIISESIEAMDWQRIVEVRARIDRKIMEQLRPKDLFYQILHGLRSLTNYDHSSALLICDHREDSLELVAEQIAWLKGKSHRIGLRLPMNDRAWRLMQDGVICGFNRDDGYWREWLGQDSTALAELLDYNNAAG